MTRADVLAGDGRRARWSSSSPTIDRRAAPRRHRRPPAVLRVLPRRPGRRRHGDRARAGARRAGRRRAGLAGAGAARGAGDRAGPVAAQGAAALLRARAGPRRARAAAGVARRVRAPRRGDATWSPGPSPRSAGRWWTPTTWTLASLPSHLRPQRPGRRQPAGGCSPRAPTSAICGAGCPAGRRTRCPGPPRRWSGAASTDVPAEPLPEVVERRLAGHEVRGWPAWSTRARRSGCVCCPRGPRPSPPTTAACAAPCCWGSAPRSGPSPRAWTCRPGSRCRGRRTRRARPCSRTAWPPP